jgi:general secretion pathway protein D/MSHA biogenesis protein MshL
LKHLKSKIYKQVIIEARIMEVRLDDSHQMGINWSNILSVASRANSETMGGTLGFGEAWERAGGEVLSSVVYPTHKLLNFMTLNSQNFSLAIEALKTYGKTNVLSNPKIALMNGHGASITVGEDITYIDKVTSTTDENGNVTYTVTTGSVLSGLGLAVMANIVDDKEVILYVVPVTSELQPAPNGDDIEYRAFGGAQVGLPRVRLRELATMSRIRDGETLIIGGHIDKVKGNTTNSVPLLGDIPGLGWLFKHDAQTTTTRELVIFLTPKIIGS